jgi:hypothetical protein
MGNTSPSSNSGYVSKNDLLNLISLSTLSQAQVSNLLSNITPISAQGTQYYSIFDISNWIAYNAPQPDTRFFDAITAKAIYVCNSPCTRNAANTSLTQMMSYQGNNMNNYIDPVIIMSPQTFLQLAQGSLKF